MGSLKGSVHSSLEILAKRKYIARRFYKFLNQCCKHQYAKNLDGLRIDIENHISAGMSIYNLKGLFLGSKVTFQGF